MNAWETLTVSGSKADVTVIPLFNAKESSPSTSSKVTEKGGALRHKLPLDTLYLYMRSSHTQHSNNNYTSQGNLEFHSNHTLACNRAAAFHEGSQHITLKVNVRITKKCFNCQHGCGHDFCICCPCFIERDSCLCHVLISYVVFHVQFCYFPLILYECNRANESKSYHPPSVECIRQGLESSRVRPKLTINVYCSRFVFS